MIHHTTVNIDLFHNPRFQFICKKLATNNVLVLKIVNSDQQIVDSIVGYFIV